MAQVDDFNDWHWQIRNSIKSLEQLKKHIKMDQDANRWMMENFSLAPLPFSVTPYFASLMDAKPDCPIFSQVISSQKELVFDTDELSDPLGEEARKKVPHLVHRYPDRVLFFATDRCASYCRFCTRKRWVGQGPTPNNEQHDEAFAYIAQSSAIKEIIFSGGDPLILSNERIDSLLFRSFSIRHIQNVRFHSRLLSFAPMRIEENLCQIFSKYSPIYLVTHFNHPKEITAKASESIAMLRRCGVILLNQSVLLKNVNDDEAVLKKLFYTLVKNGVKPYYLHLCDVVNGAKHFRVPLARSLQIMKNLRGHISGLCLPTLVVDIPNGHGKVPLSFNPIVDEDDDYVYLEGFKGGKARYPKI